MRILVLEDSADKLRRICRCLTSVTGVTIRDIETCVDASEARRRLQSRKFDLFILDIQIPEQPDMMPDGEAGLALFEDIAHITGYIVPDHIVVLTAYEELEKAAGVRVAGQSWSLVRYEPESEEWSSVVVNKALHILAAAEGRVAARPEYGCDIAVVCALDSPELVSVLQNGWGWARKPMTNDHALYYEAEYTCHGERHTAVACAAPRMGMTAAAVTAMKAIQFFRPRYLVMTGIAAGIRNRVNLGDVIVVETAFDYGSGKLDRTLGRSRFLVSPHHLQLLPELRSFARMFVDDDVWLSSVRKKWPGQKPDTALRVHIGPLASGAAVLADSKVTERVVLQHRNLLGVDMEAYAIFAAALEASEPRPKPLVMKAVCDFADEEKDDAFQHYAAFTSAALFAKFAEEWL